ncbi:hypothetical protein ACQ4PT_009068 [Festuca glaucescens]
MPRAQSGQAHDEDQQTFDNYFGELDGMYNDNFDFDISSNNRNIRGGDPTNDHNVVEGPKARKKRLQRLTFQQTQILQGFFSMCTHPDEYQMRELSEATGLTAQQVKFWFQNKITQITLISLLQAETLPSSRQSFQLDSAAENVVARQNDIQMIAELTQNAMDEFVILSESHGPLWQPVPGGSFEILNKMAYAAKFGGDNSANIIGFKTEATRADVVVMMGAKYIMDYLMDSECYASLCPGIISSAKTIKAYKWPTNAGYNGATRLMTIETVFPSPLVPSRKCTFVRSCRELQNGTMLVVDVSLDGSDGTFFKCRKMPSGVLIQPLERNSCKIIAIEHVLVYDTGVHELYQPCLGGLMFGARRWVTSIARQCVRLRDTFHVTRSALRANSKGKKTLMKLADGLLISYNNSIAAIPEDIWTIVRGTGTDQNIKIAHRRNDDRNNTAIVSVSTSFQLPMPLRATFDHLRNNMLRPEWDVLVKSGVVREEVHVSSSAEADDVVSILHVKNARENKENIMILQNSY